jgi:hypothetical protein
MCQASCTHGRDDRGRYVWLGFVKEIDNLEDPDVDWSKILRWVTNK